MVQGTHIMSSCYQMFFLSEFAYCVYTTTAKQIMLKIGLCQADIFFEGVICTILQTYMYVEGPFRWMGDWRRQRGRI